MKKPDKIFVAYNPSTNKPVQINVFKTDTAWIAGIDGVRGIFNGETAMVAAKSAASTCKLSQNLTEVSLEPVAPPSKEVDLIEEFGGILQKYTTAIKKTGDPNNVGYARFTLVGFVKTLIEENKQLQTQVNELQSVLATYERADTWSHASRG